MKRTIMIAVLLAIGLGGVVVCFSVRHRRAASLEGEKVADRTQPERAARALFEAFAREDWTKAAQFWPSALPGIDDRIKGLLGGLQLVRLDTPCRKKPPFKVGSYEGPWQPGDGDPWIPYEIRTRSGAVRQADLRLTWTGMNWELAGGL